MVRDINTSKPVDVKKRAEKANSTKKENKLWHDVKVSFWTGFIVTLIFLVAYVIPRWKAYVNAIRVAHSHPEIVETLTLPEEITKKGSFEITLSK